MTGQQITAQELKARIDAGLPDGILVDVRTEAEFAKGAIVGAKNIPVDRITVHADELKPYKHVYLYCLSGSRSELALLQLQASGVTGDLYSLTSGLLAWRAAGYSVQ